MPPPRGDGPLISILLPTRKRVPWLSRSIEHFLRNTMDHNNIEFIFKIDDDDVETAAFLQQAQGKLPMTIMHGPRGRGYLDMHLWVNEMAKVARGDWLILTNDDAALVSYGWDRMLLGFQHIDMYHGVEEMTVLGTYVNHGPAEAFPLVRREFIEVLGHFSMHYGVDHYVWKIAKFCECAFYIPIHFYHAPRNEVLDETGQDVLRDIQGPDGHKTITSAAVSELRLAAAAKVIAYLKSRGV